MEQSVLQFTAHILEINHIPMQRIRLPLAEKSPIDFGLRRAILQSHSLPLNLEEFFESRHPNTVYLLTDPFQCCYVVMRLNRKEFLVCGPALFEPMSEDRFTAIMKDLEVPRQLYSQLQDYYRQISVSLSQQTFISIITALAENIYGIGAFQLVSPGGKEEQKWMRAGSGPFQTAESPLLSMELADRYYQLERELMYAVSQGDQHRASEAASKLLSSCDLPLFLDPLRGAKDALLGLNMLLCIAANHSGIHPVHTQPLRLRGIRLCEELVSMDQAPALAQHLVRDYCQAVREHALKNYSPLIHRVIDLIDLNLSADLRLKSIAVQVNVNASYLSALFAREVGMPLTDYVNQKRIDYAKFLLQSTTLQIKRIVELVGISDVYYFSRLFKKITGETPRKYRETHQADTREYRLVEVE